LRHLRKTAKNTIVHAEGYYYGKGKACNQLVDTENQGIAYYLETIGRIKKTFKIVEADPGASHYSFAGNKVFESEHHPVHRKIIKDKHIDYRKKDEEVESSGVNYPFPQAGAMRVDDDMIRNIYLAIHIFNDNTKICTTQVANLLIKKKQV
jgi:hypothetical protein